MRKLIKGGVSTQKFFSPPEPVFRTIDKTIPIHHSYTKGEVRIPIRIYSPSAEQGPLPIVIFFHGGGWVLCTIETHDDICRHICNKAKCIVVSVEYRLAPEFKFPIPLEDSYAAALWVHEHAHEFGGDASRIALAGDSAGGNLSIGCTLLSKERDGPKFCGQALIYPSTDLRDTHYVSYDGKNIGLNKEDSDWFLRHYFSSDAEKNDVRASPILAPDLSDLPPAIIITGEHDRIRDPGEQFGKRLRDAGVAVTFKRYDAVGHGFLSIGAPEVARQSLDLVSQWLRRIFAGDTQSQDLILGASSSDGSNFVSPPVSP